MFSAFYPHITLSEPSQLNNTNFFSYKFDVKNEGSLPVFFVRYSLDFKKIAPESGSGAFLAPEEGTGTQLMRTSDMIGTLEPGDAYTFTAESVLGGLTQFKRVGPDTDFTIVISYVPLFPTVRMNACMHFKPFTDVGGAQHWFRSTGGKCPPASWFDYQNPHQPSS
jgi:hypothetical protein